MKCIVNNQVVLSRAPEGPLAAQIGSFAESVSKQGYSLASIHRQVLLAACFSRWLQQNGVGRRSLCSDHPARYLRYRARHVRPCRGDAAALKYLIGFLRSEGVIPREKKLACQSSPAEHCCPRCTVGICWRSARAGPSDNHQLRSVRPQFSRRSFRPRTSHALATLRTRCCEVRTAPSATTAHEARQAHDRRIALIPAVRARYLGEVTLDLAAAVPIVANWSMTSIPRGISTEHVRQLLASIDRRTAVGRRDYAILLLLARLGLRSGEVASLELDDIDWNVGQVNVHAARAVSATDCP